MVERRFPRELASLASVHEFLGGFCRERGIEADRAFDLDLVVEELFTNLVRHGHGAHEIRLGLEGDARRVAVTLTDDDAEPYDPTAADDDVERRNADLRSGGRGLRLVRQLTDELRYDYRDRTGTITAVKRWGP